MNDLTDEQINKYVNEEFTETFIEEYENQLLRVMKIRQENYPSKRNDNEWLNFTNFVCRRRCQRNAEKEMNNE